MYKAKPPDLSLVKIVYLKRRSDLLLHFRFC